MKKITFITAIAALLALAMPTAATYASTVTGSINGTITAPRPNNGGGGGGGGSSLLRGDANKDGKVDIQDFIALMANWGKKGTGNIADFNTDGNVDILDFVILMSNWTK